MHTRKHLFRIVIFSILILLLSSPPIMAELCTPGLLRAMKEEGLSNKQIKLVCDKAKLYDGISDTKSDSPSDSLLKSDVENIFKSEKAEDEPIYKFVSMSKTNGVDKGNGKYRLEYKGRVESLRDLYVWLDDKIHTWKTTIGTNRVVKKGGEREYLGVSIYELTEKGWRLDAYKIIISDGIEFTKH
jgi:hypothetical protein